MMKTLAVALALCLPFVAAAGEAVDTDAILADLMEGNARFVRGDKGQLPRIDEKRREELVAGQAPKATILSCSDSRVPPEHLFRQGLGDIFVARIAGNVAMSGMVASVEYAVEHLHTPVIVVLGHSSCGAVKATIEQVELGEKAPELTRDLYALVKEIAPAVEAAIKDVEEHGGDLVAKAVELNAFNAAANLLHASDVLAHAVKIGEVRVVVAEYDLGTGAVTILDGDFRGATH